jgi:CheY-like chemotaxis protein
MTAKPNIGSTSLCVLIVEDNEHMRRLLRTLLSAMGIRQIHEFADGEAGLAAVKALKPDFILTDFSMAPMDGVEFTRAVRRLPENGECVVPIIMVTGHTERRRVQIARDAGVTEILAKPVTAAALYQRIETIVNKPRPFVRTPDYIGPCRRRRALPDYIGPWRRKDDQMRDTVSVDVPEDSAGDTKDGAPATPRSAA